ncbi:hypothetical protein QW131_10550 [Roseibium salinum]|nr:hypothetical protein [Roseibium salinum]
MAQRPSGRRGQKLSGILLEAETLGDGRQAVVIGFGVNCVSHPPLSLYEATDLRSLGFQVTAERLFDALAAAMAEQLAHWGGSRADSRLFAVPG